MDKKDIIREVFEESINQKKRFLSDAKNVESISKAASMLVECMRRGGKVIVFGNGGSAADSQHFAAELVVRFEKERKGLPCVALTTDTSILTAASNDYGYKSIFARQIGALAFDRDVAVAISTSGNSENVLEGARAARSKGLAVIALTGRSGGRLLKEADLAIVAGAENTARIQEIHVTIIHILCKLVEDEMARGA